jgi:hypothetical protein
MKKLLTMLVALTCVTAVGLSACKNDKGASATGTAATGTTATSTTATSTAT